MTCEISVLCSKGDLKLTWDPEKPDEVTAARAEVEKLREQGYSFFVADGSPADEVEAGRGELLLRRAEDPVGELQPPPGESGGEEAPSGSGTPAVGRRRGRPGGKAVAIPPMRGG